MRYIIGIDLGTTNCGVAYVDTEQQPLAIQQLRLPQLVAEGVSDSLPTLPSCCYLSAASEWPEGSLNLPWKKNQPDFFVGRFAAIQGAKVPTRLVQSAKSWLCHAAANRREKILPFEALDSESRISPVEASMRFLEHIKEAWNYLIPQGNPDLEFELQEIILTVPASFDEVARSLTAEAAKLAGLTHLTLIEEPQAAFYSWLAQHESIWYQKLPLGSLVLVCDVGGGTTDFSLIDVKGTLEKPILERMAVGEHLLLGGDNMDAAIAHLLEEKIFSGEPTSLQWMQLKAQVRAAKEALLADNQDALSSFRIALQGRGSSVVAESQSVEINRKDIEKLLVDGFFGLYDWSDAIKLRKNSGIRRVGLPYEDEPSITKHLAHFLEASTNRDLKPRAPDFVLFNGAAMKPSLFQQAILDSLKRWFPDKSPEILPSFHLDLAVSRGAVYYGKARRGYGVKVSGGMARGYYLGLNLEQKDGEPTPHALTLLPRGSEEGSSYESPQVFLLQPNTPVAFQLYTSHVRLHDQSGDIIAIDSEELHPLPPIHTILRFGKKSAGNALQEKIPVHLAINLNAIGTLELWLKSQISDHKWSLEFQLRTAAGQENSLSMLGKARHDESFDEELLNKGKAAIQEAFSGSLEVKIEKLMESLETILEKPRRQWSSSLLRGFWQTLLLQADRRKASSEYEARWWNLAGFLLRPGFGFPHDDFRLKEVWKLLLSDLKVVQSAECQIQKSIFYRRIAGGLNKGQQTQIAHELLPAILKKNGRIEIKAKNELYQYAEKIRALASFELLEIGMKIKIAQALLDRILAGSAISADFWALGRIGARCLFHGSLANVVPKETCSLWLDRLLSLKPDLYKAENLKELLFCLGQLARKTDQRQINISEELVGKLLERFSSSDKEGILAKILQENSPQTLLEQEHIFGERLPIGLSLFQQH